MEGERQSNEKWALLITDAKGMRGVLEGGGKACWKGGAGFVHVWSHQGTEMKRSTNGITEKGSFTRGNTKKGIKEIILAVGGKHIKGG